MPDISVIMAVYGESESQIRRALDSLLTQSFQNFECIVVLDNPHNTQARDFLLEEQGKDSRIVFIENAKNIKLGASLNIGIAQARGTYLARMDADDTCDTQRFEKQHTYLKKNPQIDLLFTGWTQIDENGDEELRIPKKKDFKNLEKTFFYKSPLLHASMMCKKEVFDACKYPEIDRPEDFSLFLDLIAGGNVFDVLEESLYSFYVTTFDTAKKYEKIRIFSTNYLHILSKSIQRFRMNPYFWWMFGITLIQWLLSRNRHVFGLFFEGAQKIYKKIFL